ncbi:MAG: hypothetical protein QNJ98_05845 [Planctomycetota bacterium]|nr:hypothetical protein [Planctomycetota bacterium]
MTRTLTRFVLAALLLGALCAPSAAAPGLLYEPTFRAGSPGDVLVPGKPALTRGHLDAFVDLFESAFDLALPLAAEQDLRDRIEVDFEKADNEQRAAWIGLVKDLPAMRVAAKAGRTGEVRAGLRSFRLALDKRMVAAPRHPVHMLLTLQLERRYIPLWPGNPPVAAGPAQAYLEAVEFVVGLGRGEAVPVSVTQRRMLEERLRRGLFTQPQAVREELAAFHRLWLAAKAAWDRGDDSARFRARWSAVLLMSRLLPEAERVEIEPGPTLKAYAAAATKVREAQSGYDAIATAARNPATVLVVLKTGLSLDVKPDAPTFLFR